VEGAAGARSWGGNHTVRAPVGMGGRLGSHPLPWGEQRRIRHGRSNTVERLRQHDAGTCLTSGVRLTGRMGRLHQILLQGGGPPEEALGGQERRALLLV